MLYRLGSLRYFLAVTETGSVRSAAASCNISQPALTRHIQSLEEELNVPLFERTSRGMTLTPFGEIVLHHAKQVAFSCDDLFNEIGEIVSGTTGTLRISAGPGWSYNIVPEAISRMHRQAPSINVECNSALIAESLPTLRDGTVDLVINRLDTYQSPKEDLVQDKLLTIGQYIFAGKNHPLRQQSNRNIADLSAYPWISFRNSVEARQTIRTLFEDAGIQPPEPIVVTNSYQTCLNLLQSGDYLMVLPSTLVHIARQQGIEILRVDVKLGAFPAGLIYRRSSLRLAYFSRFKALLEEVVQERRGLLETPG